VKVQVVHNLTTLRSRIARDTIAALPVTETLREEPGNPDAVPNEGLVRRLDARDGLDVALGDDEQVDRRLRIEILEGEHLFVLKFDLGRAFSGDDAAEYAAWGHVPLEVVYTRLVDRRQQRSIIEGERDGHLPQVQAENPKER
jgi:hypothetical protein